MSSCHRYSGSSPTRPRSCTVSRLAVGGGGGGDEHAQVSPPGSSGSVASMVLASGSTVTSRSRSSPVGVGQSVGAVLDGGRRPARRRSAPAASTPRRARPRPWSGPGRCRGRRRPPARRVGQRLQDHPDGDLALVVEARSGSGRGRPRCASRWRRWRPRRRRRGRSGRRARCRRPGRRRRSRSRRTCRRRPSRCPTPADPASARPRRRRRRAVGGRRRRLVSPSSSAAAGGQQQRRPARGRDPSQPPPGTDPDAAWPDPPAAPGTGSG